MIEIQQSAAFYLRGALNRALTANQLDIEVMETAIEDEDCPGIYKDQFRGLVAYQKQWRREAMEEFRSFPESIRPLLEDRYSAE